MHGIAVNSIISEPYTANDDGKAWELHIIWDGS